MRMMCTLGCIVGAVYDMLQYHVILQTARVLGGMEHINFFSLLVCGSWRTIATGMSSNITQELSMG